MNVLSIRSQWFSLIQCTHRGQPDQWPLLKGHLEPSVFLHRFWVARLWWSITDRSGISLVCFPLFFFVATKAYEMDYYTVCVVIIFLALVLLVKSRASSLQPLREGLGGIRCCFLQRDWQLSRQYSLMFARCSLRGKRLCPVHLLFYHVLRCNSLCWRINCWVQQSWFWFPAAPSLSFSSLQLAPQNNF